MARSVSVAFFFASFALLTSGDRAPVTEFQEVPSHSFDECDDTKFCFSKNVTGFSSPKIWMEDSDSESGFWMTDPTEACNAKIYSTSRFSYDHVSHIYVYSSMANLKKKRAQRSIKVPGSLAGTGAVVWKNSLYYTLLANRSIARLDLTSGRVLSLRALPRNIPHTNNGGQYLWGGYTDIDFAVSETGIYVIYSSIADDLRLVVSKMDPKSLEFEFAYTTTKRKQRFGQCFVVCATLYCTGSYNSKVTTTTLVYDIINRQEISRPLPFTIGPNYNSYLAYNPADKKVYSWNAYSRVTYDVFFS